jgi:hypothetical protein
VDKRSSSQSLKAKETTYVPLEKLISRVLENDGCDLTDRIIRAGLVFLALAIPLPKFPALAMKALSCQPMAAFPTIRPRENAPAVGLEYVGGIVERTGNDDAVEP